MPASRWSIAGRMTLLFAASTIVFLICYTLILLYSLLDIITTHNHRFVDDEIRVLQRLITADGLAAVIHEIEIEHESREHTKHYVRVLGDGRPLVETRGMSDIIPIAAFSLAADKDGLIQWSVEEKEFNLKSLIVQAKGYEGKLVLQVAFDVSDDREVVREYYRIALLLLVIGIVFACVASATLARRGLRPVREITRKAGQVTAETLDEKIDEESWPGELYGLVHALNGMLERLRSSFQRLSDFTGYIAHELRTPICNLVGEAEVVLTRERGAEEYRQVISSALTEYRRLSRMIDGLLFLAVAERGEADLERQRADAAGEIRHVLEQYTQVIAEKNIHVRLRGAAVAFVDVELFRRAVSNILSNAIKFTPAGGEITVFMEEEPFDTVITVSDTGCGIEKADIDSLTERFFRGRHGGHKYEGSGLGLAIVKAVMDMHEGEIAIGSTPGAGTSVTLSFPNSPWKGENLSNL